MKRRHASILSCGLALAAVALVAVPRPVVADATAPASLSTTICVQDQYGNQYTFLVDEANQYVHGTVLSGQGCLTPTWPVTGSYVKANGQLVFEVTAANPLGAAGNCVTTYKLKGAYPSFGWYYENGFGGQLSTFVTCGSEATANPQQGGMLGL